MKSDSENSGQEKIDYCRIYSFWDLPKPKKEVYGLLGKSIAHKILEGVDIMAAAFE